MFATGSNQAFVKYDKEKKQISIVFSESGNAMFKKALQAVYGDAHARLLYDVVQREVNWKLDVTDSTPCPKDKALEL